jgi:hypothetical protein
MPERQQCIQSFGGLTRRFEKDCRKPKHNGDQRILESKLESKSAKSEKYKSKPAERTDASTVFDH